MDQKRLFVAILISLAILVGYQFIATRYLPHPPVPQTTATSAGTPNGAANGTSAGTSGVTATSGPPAAAAAAAAARAAAPRVAIDAPSVHGSISLLGARIDDLVLTDYRETMAPNSPASGCSSRAGTKQPYYAQYGWSAAPGEHVAAAGQRHRLDRLGQDACARPSGDAVVGQRRRA